MDTTTKLHVWADLMFACETRLKNEAVLDFRLYEIIHFDGAKGDGPPRYELIDAVSLPADTTDDLSKAQPLVEGILKWDGCSDWVFAHRAHHFCSRHGLEQFGLALLRIFDLGKELLPLWDPSL